MNIPAETGARSYLVLFLLVALAYGLFVAWTVNRSPGGTFFAGDMGQNYILTRNFADSGVDRLSMPERPMELQIPGLRPDMFLLPHNGQLYPIFSHTFALINAPFYNVFGYRGLFVLPAFSVILILGIVTVLLYRRRAGLGRTGVALAFVLGTPAAFYGTTYWEHGPAMTLTTLALALILTDRRHLTVFVAGSIVGLSCLLRAEGILFAVSVCIVLFVLQLSKLSVTPALFRCLLDRLSASFVFGLGFLLGWLPAALLNLATIGHILGPQWYYNRNKIASAAERLTLNDQVFAGVSTFGLLLGAFVLIWGFRWQMNRPHRPMPLAVYGIVAVAGTVYAPVLYAMYAHASMSPLSFLQQPNFYTNLFFTAPPLCAGLFVLLSRTGKWPVDIRLVFGVAVSYSALFAITATTSGGLQWGPRLLISWLPIAVALSVLHLDLRTWAGRVLVLMVLVAGVIQQMAAQEMLQRQRLKYHALQQGLENFTQQGDIILTNRSWLYLETPELYFSRTMLRILGPKDFGSVLESSTRHGMVKVVLETEDIGSLDAYRMAAEGIGFRLHSIGQIGRLQVFLPTAEAIGP